MFCALYSLVKLGTRLMSLKMDLKSFKLETLAKFFVDDVLGEYFAKIFFWMTFMNY